MQPNRVVTLEPPYRDFVGLIGQLPVLGAIALTRVDALHGLSPHLTELLERAPWTIPCIAIAPAAVSAAALQSIWALPVQPAVLIGLDASGRVTPAAATAAATNRPRPTVSQLVGYVVRRTNSIMLGQTLDQIWQPRTSFGGGNAERTLRYRLRRLGSHGSHDWLRIHRLVQTKTKGAGLGVEEQANLAGTEARTLRTWVARYLGMTLRTFRATIGWEWILELALRRGDVRIEDGPIHLEAADPARPPRRVAETSKTVAPIG